MHPIFGSRTNFLLYVSACLLVGGMLGTLLATATQLSVAESAAITWPLMMFLAFICLSPWYTCRSMPLNSTAPWKLLTNHLMAAVVSSAMVVLLARVLVSGLTGAFQGIEQRFRPALPLLSAMVVMLYLLSIAIHYMALAVQSSQHAEVLARDAELKALKAQINPHFLFNSLNSISALTTVDPAKARDMCIRLSDFLRISLRMGEGSSISFGEELALARIYLDVEQLRFGKRLRVRQEIDSECSDCDVPPLIVQPLIENAIKHGISTMVEGGEIVLRGGCSQSAMRFIVENPFDPEAKATRKSGIGLVNVRKRLHARYGNAARLDVEVEADRYRATLLIPYTVKAHEDRSAV
jgi:two-component system sensor histidine kinase AlgZ